MFLVLLVIASIIFSVLFQYNDISVTKTVVTDKDCAEIAAFAEIFPEASQLLCQFHVLKAVDSRLVKAKLIHSEKKEIFDYFKKALRAKNLDELSDAAGYLSSIGTSYSVLLLFLNVKLCITLNYLIY